MHEFETWRRVFLDSGASGLKQNRRASKKRALAKVGELTMKLELLEWFVEK